MNKFSKITLHWIGSGLSILGIVFITNKLLEYKDQIKVSNLDFWSWALLLILTICYSMAGILLALAWRNLLRYSNISIQRRWAIWAYGISQLAKYLPGNIFHLVSRQTIGAGVGLPTWPLAKATIWEAGTITLTGSLYILLILPIFFPSVSQPIASLLFLTALLFGVFFIQRSVSTSLALAVFQYAVFLGLSGLIFLAVLALSQTRFSANIPLICGAYVTAWLVGLVTPGAPAGAGIRELVLYGLLHTLITKEEIVVAILLARMVTVVGDLFFYLIAAFLFYQKEPVILEQK